mmetsp:Transcript_97103/g.296759  ORF Transcript_97103/g.296759 Transcript_97103/m.296759 type:complete len:118 (-) Transcript_97103:146-499(-)
MRTSALMQKPLFHAFLLVAWSDVAKYVAGPAMDHFECAKPAIGLNPVRRMLSPYWIDVWWYKVLVPYFFNRADLGSHVTEASAEALDEEVAEALDDVLAAAARNCKAFQEHAPSPSM